MGGRLTIIGGGVMGLMAAYYAAPLADAVTVLVDVATASGVDTRSRTTWWPTTSSILGAVPGDTVYDIGRFTAARFAERIAS